MKYNIGRLKNFVYLISGLEYQVSDYKVYITKGDVYKLHTNVTTFSENETFAGRFRFNTTVTCTLNRIIDDSLFKQKNFYIVVENYEGLQFLVSPEFTAKYSSELTINEQITYVINFNTQSNIPTRILASKITAINDDKPYQYNGLGFTDLYIGQTNWYKVEYLTAEYTRNSNGEIQLVFSYPIGDNDYHYDLINFPDNRWNIQVVTPDSVISEYNLFPQYTRQNERFTITLRGVKQGQLAGNTSQEAQYRWQPTDEFICDSFNKYVKEVRQQYVDGTWKNTGESRKGQLVERNSDYCGYAAGDLYRWVTLEGYICVGFEKHYKQKEQKSVDGGETWTDTGVERVGDLIEINSADCGYYVEEWKEVPGEYICEEYDPSVTWVLLSDQYYCNVITV